MIAFLEGICHSKYMRSRKGNILVIILGILLLISASVTAYFYWQLQQSKLTVPTALVTEAPTTKPGFFSDGAVSFQYPPDWKQTKQEKLPDQGYVWLESPDTVYRLTFGWVKNYNSQTSKPYSDILDFLNYPPSPLPPKGVKNAYVGGQNAIKIDLHFENFGTSNEVNLTGYYFFSSDSTKIYSLEMRIAAADFGEIRTGTGNLDQTVSSFKFTKK